jgi:hypothetical protein
MLISCSIQRTKGLAVEFKVSGAMRRILYGSDCGARQLEALPPCGFKIARFIARNTKEKFVIFPICKRVPESLCGVIAGHVRRDWNL